MKKKVLMIGAAVVVVAGAGLIMAMRGRGDKPLEVQTAKADRQKTFRR